MNEQTVDLPDADSPHGLQVKDLSVEIAADRGSVRAVDAVSFDVEPGEMFVIAGESGCGKTTTALAIAGLLPDALTVESGRALVDGVDVLAVDSESRRRMAGSTISIVFQNALTSLNPVSKVGIQLAEPFQIHEHLRRGEALKRALELMHRVGIPDAAARINSYPHEFSGGMRQRLLIAMAIALRPRVLLADEPTTALDVTVQAQVMTLLKDLRQEYGMAVLLITHDLGLAAEYADRAGVMYGGRLVEIGSAKDLFSRPTHPYTRGLVELARMKVGRSRDLQTIAGSPPVLGSVTTGCVYQDRCPIVADVCQTNSPLFVDVAPGHGAACHFAEREAEL